MITTKVFKSHFIEGTGTSPLSPLLLLVHGRTGNIKLMEWYSKRFKIQGLNYMTIEAPFEDKRPDQQDQGFSWYLMEGYQGLEKSRLGLQTLIQELKDQGLSSEKIFWLGFSQGAAMGLDLALRGPHKLGGVMAISGFCIKSKEYPEAFGPHAKTQRLLITHGTRDEIIAFEDAKRTYDRLEALEVPFEFITYDKRHSFDLKNEIPFLESKMKEWIL